MKTGLLLFVGGVVAATIARLASACPCARTVAIKGLARSMTATERVKEKLNKIKADAEEICKEAKACAEAEQQGHPCCQDNKCETPQK